MKRFAWVALVALLGLGACSTKPGQGGAAPASGPVITFAETEKSLGEVNDSADAVYVFNFKNTGKATLHIESVKGG